MHGPHDRRMQVLCTGWMLASNTRRNMRMPMHSVCHDCRRYVLRLLWRSTRNSLFCLVWYRSSMRKRPGHMHVGITCHLRDQCANPATQPELVPYTTKCQHTLIVLLGRRTARPCTAYAAHRADQGLRLHCDIAATIGASAGPVGRWQPMNGWLADCIARQRRTFSVAFAVRLCPQCSRDRGLNSGRPARGARWAPASQMRRRR